MERARSSAGEHSLHTGGVTGSIPVAPTIRTKRLAETALRAPKNFQQEKGDHGARQHRQDHLKSDKPKQKRRELNGLVVPCFAIVFRPPTSFPPDQHRQLALEFGPTVSSRTFARSPFWPAPHVAPGRLGRVSGPDLSDLGDRRRSGPLLRWGRSSARVDRFISWIKKYSHIVFIVIFFGACGVSPYRPESPFRMHLL